MKSKKLVHRLNRIQGQIEAIKRNLEDTDFQNCEENIQLLKTVQGGLQKFGKAYINVYAQECINDVSEPIDIKKKYNEILQSALEL